MNTVDHRQLADTLLPAVLAAGACLLRHRSAGISSERKADGSPVTAADRDAEAIITAALARADPSIPVIGEEAVAAGHVPPVADRAFLVDALDGTREYIRGGDDFTVNVALVVDGAPAFGILLAPAAGRLFATLGPAETAAARIETSRLAEVGYQPVLTPVSTIEPDPSALRVLTSRSHRSAETDAFLANFKVAQMTGIGSSLKFGLIAAGEADMYPRLGPTSAWDIAAGHAVLTAAGGAVTTIEGKPLGYNLASGDFINPHFVAWGRLSLLDERCR